LDKRVPVLITKPSIFGFGLNLQQCRNVAFVGLSDSFESYYQSVRRCWRFGQKRTVHAHIITSELEGAVVANIKRKEADALNKIKILTEKLAELA
jgi:SNF2 family DNA or RNA helicase